MLWLTQCHSWRGAWSVLLISCPWGRITFTHASSASSPELPRRGIGPTLPSAAGERWGVSSCFQDHGALLNPTGGGSSGGHHLHTHATSWLTSGLAISPVLTRSGKLTQAHATRACSTVLPRLGAPPALLCIAASEGWGQLYTYKYQCGYQHVPRWFSRPGMSA